MIGTQQIVTKICQRLEPFNQPCTVNVTRSKIIIFGQAARRFGPKCEPGQGPPHPTILSVTATWLLSVPFPDIWNRKGTESGLVGPRNKFFRILCSELIFRKLNQSKVSITESVHHTLPADIQLTGIQLYWVKMSTKDTSVHSFFAFFSLLEKTETLDKKGDPHTN